jgi:hypothetical protein
MTNDVTRDFLGGALPIVTRSSKKGGRCLRIVRFSVLRAAESGAEFSSDERYVDDTWGASVVDWVCAARARYVNDSWAAEVGRWQLAQQMQSSSQTAPTPAHPRCCKPKPPRRLAAWQIRLRTRLIGLAKRALARLGRGASQ